MRRSPHGERGLKSASSRALYPRRQGSLPSRGAWIEIVFAYAPPFLSVVAPLTGSVD